MIKSSGYAHTLVVWGVIQGVIGILRRNGCARRRRIIRCRRGASPSAIAAQQTKRSYTPREMLKSPVFYLLFVMMSMMSTSGLMVVSNVGPFAKEFGVANMLVFGMAALPLSLTLSRFTNGLTRPFFGWVSDHIGREARWRSPSRWKRRHPHSVRLHRPTGAVRGADRARVLRLGRNLFAVSLDPDRHVRAEICGDELRLPLYRPGRRLDPGRTGGGLPQADDRKLDRRVHRRRGARCGDRAAGDHRAAGHATQAFCAHG
jgi:hypothetical protein